MSLYKNKYRNESARLPGYDYSRPGYYFVTVCTHDRGHLFGEIDNGVMVLNKYGKIVRGEWDNTGFANPHIKLNSFQIMPNHFHGIIQIVHRVGGDAANIPATNNDYHATGAIKNETMAAISPNAGSLSQIIRSFKSAITKRINQTRNTPGARVLQPRFHDHIIRNENELFRIRQYIKNNPLNWEIHKMNDRDENSVMETSAPYGEEPWMAQTTIF